MNLNAVKDRHRVALHHEAILCAYSPKRDRGGSETIVDSGFGTDSRAGANVVQREVAKRMDYLVAKLDWHDERAAVDDGSRRRRRELRSVTNGTTDGIKQIPTGGDVAVDRSSPGSSGSRLEGRKCLDVIPVVFRIGNAVKRSRRLTEVQLD